jgi:hypothetical protein
VGVSMQAIRQFVGGQDDDHGNFSPKGLGRLGFTKIRLRWENVQKKEKKMKKKKSIFTFRPRRYSKSAGYVERERRQQQPKTHLDCGGDILKQIFSKTTSIISCLLQNLSSIQLQKQNKTPLRPTTFRGGTDFGRTEFGIIPFLSKPGLGRTGLW